MNFPPPTSKASNIRVFLFAVILLILLIVALVLLLIPTDHGFNFSKDFESNLPIILLNADTEQIPADYGDTIVKMRVIYNGHKKYFNGKAKISIHGASSRTFEQRSMNLKSLHKDGSNYKFPFFGFPKGKNWLLINHYNDRALMRNALSFELFKQSGHYAPRYQHCEVFLNDKYAGVYLFVEKITQDEHRVNITELEEYDNSGVALTGGYIWKYDKYDGNVLHYPKKSKIQPEQENYLFNYFIPNTFGKLWIANDEERRNIINEESFIDYLLLSELSANVDGYKKSRYFYKDRDDRDPRIHAGPVWDFDWAWKFLDDHELPNTGRYWLYSYFDPCCDGHPSSYTVLLQSDSFKNKTIERWFQLRENLYSKENLFSLVDNFYTSLSSSGASKRHLKVYQLFDNKGPLSPEVYLPRSTDFDSEIENLKKYITERLDFMDKTIHNLNASNSIHVFSFYLTLFSLLFSLSIYVL